MLDNLQEKLDRAGVFQHGIVNPRDVEFSETVRGYCEENLCRQYGKTWACPPAVGTVAECRERAQRYNTMLVFTGKYALEDSYDFDGMMTAMRDFKDIAARLSDEVRPFLSDYLLLSNEGCGRCGVCTYPDSPCRFPDSVHGSIEGYGIFVSKLAEQAGVKYNNGENTVTYFGALLFNQ
ncbi:MAG: DUF2284 domain-containing protein [Oscillospiraceae bacterium]|jgi:predicted metal-binding protein|nr:DUF2284 domain-containing protein [Oscillospiraceae bacterium]